MPTRFTILGAGAWGTAISLLLAQDPSHQVSLWCARAEHAGELNQCRENVQLLPGVTIPDSICITADIGEAAAQSDLLIVAIPTIYLRPTLERIRAELPPECPALSLVKGIEQHTFLRPSEILMQLTGSRSLAVLSGPSHAEEVSRAMPTSVVVAAEDLTLARWIQQSFSTDRFRVYTNLDVLGVELAGALKNVIGVAAGISDGLGLGDNTKAALLTRGLAEIARFGVALGAEQQTFWGLAGMGDLITTAMSPHGRNRAVGERLGKGEKLADILASTQKVAEGIYTAQSLFERASRMGISMPITAAVHKILYEDLSPYDAVNDLMLRTPKSEK
jgi:glycerol-3-phosphate dehydrogenase (NAD(P)+)